MFLTETVGAPFVESRRVVKVADGVQLLRRLPRLDAPVPVIGVTVLLTRARGARAVGPSAARVPASHPRV